MKRINEFKSIIKKSNLMDVEEMDLVDKIPNEYFQKIFDDVFNSNLSLARRVILNDFDEVERIDGARLDAQKSQIRNLHKSVLTMMDYAKSGKKIIFITDNDNDGSLSQAAILEFLKMTDDELRSNIKIAYAQTIGGNSNRGITEEVVTAHANELGLKEDSDFLLITADNGINSKEEQLRIQKKYKKSKLIITDHHLPDKDECVVENDRTIIFNPKYKPTKFFQEKNISGANVLSVLLKEFAKKYDIENGIDEELHLSKNKVHIKNMDEISKIANLLDYVDTDIADKPLKSYTIEHFTKLGPLLNVNNSLSKIITGEISDDFFESLKEYSADMDVEVLREQFSIIKSQNLQAKMLLEILRDHTLDGESVKLNSNLENIYLEKLGKKIDSQDINQNYIEQLRPHIYNLSAIDEKDAFVSELNGMMIGCFEKIRGCEKEILKEITKANVINVNKTEYSTILTPRVQEITRLFNRKLLGKAFNEENNGFILTLDNIRDNEMTGSFRSLYRIQDILEGVEKFEEENQVDISFMGHDRAAGFFIRSKNNKAIPDKELIVNNLNKFINDRVSILRDLDIKQELPNLLVDLHSIPIIDKINKVTRSSLSMNYSSIRPIIKFNKSTYLTDSQTSVQHSLQELVKERKYGYVSVNANFSGDTVIIPTELLRGVVDSNFKSALRLGYIAEGVMIASNSVKSDRIGKFIDMRTDKSIQTKLVDYYDEKFLKNNHQVDVDREHVKSLSYFKDNNYGELEFDMFESSIISILDKTGSDVFAVFDTEGTGLGKSPKLFNLGALNAQINDEKTKTMNRDDFFSSAYGNINRKMFLLTDEDKKDLIEISSEQYEELSFNEKKELLLNDNKYYIFNPKNPNRVNELEVIRNHKINGNTVEFNRELKFDMIAYLINDTDFKIAPEIEHLTNISNTMLNKVGRRTKDVDKEFVEKYKGKKVIFQAHNLPYDLGVIASNMQNLYDFMRESLVSDSALFSRVKKLAYDNVPMGRVNLDLIKNHYFYSSDYSDFSFEKFLLSGEDGIFPDRTGNYVARINDEKLYLIDRKENQEVFISEIEKAIASFELAMMPNNSIKFSVQELSVHENIRNIMLSKSDIKIEHIKIPAQLSKSKDELNYFMSEYHFDSDINTNIENFNNYLASHQLTVDLSNEDLRMFASDFLEKNKETQAKFHDSWMYKKVLRLYDPKDKYTNDVVDLLSYKTDLPKEKVIMILDDTIQYKNKFKLDKVIVDEVHNNIVYDDSNLGISDVVLEMALTIKRLCGNEYNSYSKDIKNTVEVFSYNSLDTKRKMETKDKRGLELDSYSAKQARAYRRRNSADSVAAAKGEQKNSIKFKLSKSILPTGSSLYGKLKGDVTLNPEEIEEMSKKLSDVVACEQMKSSAVNIKSLSNKAVDYALESISLNDEESLKTKREILDKFDFVYFDRRDDIMKKVSEVIYDVVINGTVPSKAIKYNFTKVDEIDISELINNYIGYAEELNIGVEYKNINKFAEVYDFDFRINELTGKIEVDELTQKHKDQLIEEMGEMKKIEAAVKMEDPDAQDQILTGNFLFDLNVKRRSILKWSSEASPKMFNKRLSEIDRVSLEKDEELALEKSISHKLS